VGGDELVIHTDSARYAWKVGELHGVWSSALPNLMTMEGIAG
jgi:hypothetical protein